MCTHCETANPDFLVHCELCGQERPADWNTPREKRNPVSSSPNALPTSQDDWPAGNPAQWASPGHGQVFTIRKFPQSLSFDPNELDPKTLRAIGTGMLIFITLIFVLEVENYPLGMISGLFSLLALLYTLQAPSVKRQPLLESGLTVNVETEGPQVRKAPYHRFQVESLSFSRDSRFLLTAGEDAVLWDSSSGAPVEYWSLPRGIHRHFSTQGFLLSVSPHELLLSDYQLRALRRLEFPGLGKALFAGLSHDLKLGVVLTASGQIIYANLDDRRPAGDYPVKVVGKMKEKFTAFSIAKTLPFFGYGTASGGLVIITTPTQKEVFRTAAFDQPVTGLAFSCLERIFAAADSLGNIRVYHLRQEDPIAIIALSLKNGDPLLISSLTFINQPACLALGTRDGKVLILDYQRKEILDTFVLGPEQVLSLEHALNGKWLAAVGTPRNVAVWKV